MAPATKRTIFKFRDFAIAKNDMQIFNFAFRESAYHIFDIPQSEIAPILHK